MENPICPKELCTGCSACYNVCPVKCIDMQIDKEGFYFPIINLENCIDCRKCENVCPILNHADFNNNNNPDVYASWHKDEKIRYESSSGGVFSALAASVIEENGIVYGAVYDSRMKVKHISINKKADIKKLRGSKYVQSYIGDTFTEIKEYLNAGKVVLFSGTPCQVAGLKNFIGTDHSNLITCDLLCKGVSSPGLFENYVNYLSRKIGGKISDVNFRDKKYGWGNTSTKIIFKDRSERYLKGIFNSFMFGFSIGLTIRNSCYHCKFTQINRVGDLTLGDFWGIYKLFFKNRANLEYHRKTLEEAVAGQGSALTKPTTINNMRKKFFENYSQVEYEQLANQYLIAKGLKGIVKKIIPNNWIYKIRRMFRN